MKHEHIKRYSTCDRTMAWSCRGKMQYRKYMQKKTKYATQHMQICEKHTSMAQKGEKSQKIHRNIKIHNTNNHKH